MLSSSVQTFSDPSDFAALIRAANVDLTVVGGGRFTAGNTAIELHSLKVQRFSESLPRIIHAENVDGTEFVFHTRTGPGFSHDGIEVTSKSMVRLGRPRS